ncbi:MAG: adenylosuccinate lyase [Candidatus Izemoplasmatales bacterium]|jgi:adenylosuccinate lyase|nr:adenylosuccinate lyase [Candidatus Izemoplasmatales bacterium]
MIDRYSRPQMRTIWSEEQRYQTYLNIEIANVKALSELGIVSPKTYETILDRATFNIQRIHEQEQETKHDVIAFTRAVCETLGEEKRWIHYGLTSTDVVDTANGVQLVQANRIIREDIEILLGVLKKRAYEFKQTYCVGRTHGIHADITVFGLKWALWYDEMQRNLKRFNDAALGVEVGKISGAVGNYAFINPEIETIILRSLGLGQPNISTQTLQRDRYAYYLATIALIGASLEKIATEIRHLQRTEVSEVKEAFALGQKGSSAMPHKRNPISSENICGLARVLRGYMVPAYENVSLWHERDISHSSVERIILVDATCLIDYMLHRYTSVLNELEVDQKRMQENIHLTHGAIFAQRIMTALIDKGQSREEAYDLIQPLALKSYTSQIHLSQLIAECKIIAPHFSESEMAEWFQYDGYATHVDTIYQRVFGEGEAQ